MMRSRSCALKASHSSVSVDRMSIASSPSGRICCSCAFDVRNRSLATRPVKNAGREPCHAAYPRLAATRATATGSILLGAPMEFKTTVVLECSMGLHSAEVGGSQGVGSAAAVPIGFPRDIVDRAAHRIEGTEAFRFRRLRLADPRFRSRECASLDKERHLEHAVMANEADRVSRFIEATAQVWKSEGHDRLVEISQASRFGGFGFRSSRLLRFCTLAIAERPFDERCVVDLLRRADRLQTVFCRYPLMTFVVVANAVLWRIIPRRQRAGDPIDVPHFWETFRTQPSAGRPARSKKDGLRPRAGSDGCVA